VQTSIDENRAAIADLSRRFRVARLKVFGSAARGDFDPHTAMWIFW
jgi:predicted nucleotidyltransferase